MLKRIVYLSSQQCNIIILGDFSSAVHTPFETELQKFCSPYELIIFYYDGYGRDLGQFTFVSDAYGCASWLDHIVCSYNVNSIF